MKTKMMYELNERDMKEIVDAYMREKYGNEFTRIDIAFSKRGVNAMVSIENGGDYE